MKHPRIATLLFGAFLYPFAGAQALDLQPTDVRAPYPGYTALLVSYQHSEFGDSYSHGVKQPGSPRLYGEQTIARLGHSFSLGDYPAYTYVQTATGYLHTGGTLGRLAGDSGLTDTAFVLAFWPYANRANESYFGIAGYLIAPTGSYDAKRAFNLGENRYRYALQSGFQLPLAERLYCVAAVDTVWHGRNGDFGPTHATLERKPLFTGQFALRYDFSQAFSVAANYFHTVGGETSVNGMARDDAMLLKRYQLTAAATLPFGRVTVQYGADLQTENGLIEDKRWLVRYLKAF